MPSFCPCDQSLVIYAASSSGGMLLYFFSFELQQGLYNLFIISTAKTLAKEFGLFQSIWAKSVSWWSNVISFSLHIQVFDLLCVYYICKLHVGQSLLTFSQTLLIHPSLWCLSVNRYWLFFIVHTMDLNTPNVMLSVAGQLCQWALALFRNQRIWFHGMSPGITSHPRSRKADLTPNRDAFWHYDWPSSGCVIVSNVRLLWKHSPCVFKALHNRTALFHCIMFLRTPMVLSDWKDHFPEKWSRVNCEN